MGSAIKGVHHIAVTPTAEQYQKTVEFYTQLLGMEVKQTWGDPERPHMMVSCGDNSCIEILSSEDEIPAGGPLAHIAFATDQVDEIMEKVRQAGYEITNQSMDASIGDQPIRVAFFYGPTHEHIELFCEK